MPSAVAMLPPVEELPAVECTVHYLYPDSTDLPADLIPLRRKFREQEVAGSNPVVPTE
ncbi:MAG TPA: hypothetical protein VHE78_15950 [Gemmatimonadaceae bacterium]|nr:hypothetical protein [Gemmatimonadaceae bacterium]